MVAIEYNRFGYAGHRVELILQFLGIDILSARAKDHVLRTTVDVDIPFFIKHAEVSGTQPSVLCERCFGCLFVLVIALHDINTLYLDLAVFAGWVF